MSLDYDVQFYRVSSDARERAQMIKDLPTGHHAAKDENGNICVLSIVQGENMTVKVQVGTKIEITNYNSNGEAVSHKTM